MAMDRITIRVDQRELEATIQEWSRQYATASFEERLRLAAPLVAVDLSEPGWITSWNEQLDDGVIVHVLAGPRLLDMLMPPQHVALDIETARARRSGWWGRLLAAFGLRRQRAR